MRCSQRAAAPPRVYALLIAVVSAAPTAIADPLTFQITLDPAFQRIPYTGRVYVVASKNLKREPRRDITRWSNPPQLFARDVTAARPGEPIVISETAMAHPRRLVDLEPGEYHIQAIARRSNDFPVPGRGSGDLLSEARVVILDPTKTGAVRLRLNRLARNRPFSQTDRIKLVEIASPALSAFHGRQVMARAAVVLPQGWHEKPDAKYPAVYMIPGFNGDHRMARFFARPEFAETIGDVLLIVPDPTCRRGHSVFADSQTNGPWGWALVKELIPEVERRFRGKGSPDHRYVTGVSSGGWSSLWLQVTYPDAFNGCWSHAPDPVDFRDFQQINLYEPGANMYTDEQGTRRPISRRGDEVSLWYDDFVRREDILGPGGQIHSFEAVFSRRDAPDRPELLFNRATGKVFPETARSWEAYDIRLILERNWDSLGPKLSGKLHVYAGEFDNFYLEGAVRRLKDSLEKLGSDAEVEIIEGMGHGMHIDAVAPMFQTVRDNYQRSLDGTSLPHDIGD